MEHEITELRLGIPGDTVSSVNEKKRGFSDMCDDGDRKVADNKSQVVGWPPVCCYRRKNSFNAKLYVKISMDGAPFLRKIDLSIYTGYPDLAMAMDKLFGSSRISEALKDAESSEYVPIYEDKDGDWMLAGDVPWDMFIESCKRIRIMKRSEAKGFGLQPRGALKGTSN